MLIDVLDKKSLIGFMQSVLNNERKEPDMRDSAFACHYLIKVGEIETVRKFIENTTGKIGTGISDCMDMAYWLWIVGDYFGVTGNFDEKADMRAISCCLDSIKTGWDQSHSHWLESSISGVFTSNVAIMYKAVSGINAFLNDNSLEQFLSDLRTFTFLENIREGEYVGKRGCLDVLGDMGDISIIAVPFGLVNLDDLFLIRSVNSVEKKLLSDGMCFSKHNYPDENDARIDLMCILSWYYSETGYMEYSEWMLQQAEKALEKSTTDHKEADSVKRLDYILFAIAQQNFIDKIQCEDKSCFKDVNIIHKPAGENDPYISRNYERYPRYPETNDSVYLKMHTQPFNLYQSAFVRLKVNGKEQPRIMMNIKTAPDGEKYWEACIGKFNFNDKVDYVFEVYFGDKKAESQVFSFTVRQWFSLKEIEHIDYSTDEMKILFKPIRNLKQIPCLHISKNGKDSIRFSFSVEQREKLYHSINIIGKANIKIFSFQLGKSNFVFNGDDMWFEILGKKNNRILGSYKSDNIKLLDLLLDGNGNVHEVRFNFLLEDKERIFGMGERFSHIEYRGLEVDNCVYDKYTDHGLKTYLPVPLFISSNGYGIFFDTTTYLKCRFGTVLPDLTDVEVNIDSSKQSMDFYIFTGKPKDIVQKYTSMTGKPALPPKWCFGLWMSSNSWNSQKDIDEQVKKANSYDIPVSVIVLEQWSDEATFYIFNGAEYKVKPGESSFSYRDFRFPRKGRWPDPKKMVRSLHRQNIKVLLWQAPYHIYFGSAVNKQRDADEKAMLDNAYYVSYKDGKPYRSHYYWFGHCLIPDFTNPEARKWWLDKRRYLLSDIGIDGFKIDGGECILDEGLLLHNGKTEEEMRNEFPNEFVKGYSDFIRQNADDGIVFCRAGTKGTQSFSLHWAGDDVSTFKAFREALNAGLSSGMSGIVFWGWDFGGFCSGLPTAELYLRSAQMAVFCPIMQFHSESMEKQKFDRTPWNIAEMTNTPQVIDIFKKYADLRMNLMPYIYQQAIFSSRTGIPMMRAMFMEYPDDARCINLTQQYMFGENILVAPVLEEGACSKDVYLPKGKWMNFFTGEELDGERYIKAEADIGQIPVYIKENSIIPLNLSKECKLFSHVGNRMNGYENLCFMLYINGDLRYEFSDEIGNTVLFEATKQENTIYVNVESNYQENMALIIRNADGFVNIRLKGIEADKAENIKTINTDAYSICIKYKNKSKQKMEVK